MADNDIASQITHIFSQYSQELNKKLRALSLKSGKELAKNIKNDAPKSPTVKATHYADGWKASMDNDSEFSTSCTVHNDKKYYLAHILEAGYTKRNGERSKSTPHINENADKAIQQFETDVEEIFK